MRSTTTRRWASEEFLSETVLEMSWGRALATEAAVGIRATVSCAGKTIAFVLVPSPEPRMSNVWTIGSWIKLLSVRAAAQTSSS
jgi:hypothetical protein